MNSEWRDRLEHWLRTLREDFYEPLGEIHWQAHRTFAHLSLPQAADLDYSPAPVGYTWGEQYEYCWFRGTVTLPPEAAGQRIVLQMDPGGEACIFVNKEAFGAYRADWIREPHHYFVDNTLAREAKAGASYEIFMEVYAGQFYPQAPTGGVATGPVLPGTYQDPLRDGSRRVLGVCTYGAWKEEAYQLYLDVRTLLGLLHVLDDSSLRAAHIARGLEQFTLTVDFEQEREDRIRDYQKARAELRPLLEAENGSTMPEFYAVGHAHLDLAWLWPFEETRRKTERTFAAQLRLMEEYPQYKFIQSQAAAYEMCRQYYPQLFAKIREAIKGGQWICEGGMWVEPDTNLAGSEALVRQILYGKRYYREMFGKDSVVLWLPDTFGYSAALPQLLKKSGLKYLVTQKIFWSYNDGDTFPYHYFNWQGLDGSEIISFLPTSYNYSNEPEELNLVWKNRRQARELEGFLIPFGYGDGGGGPTRDHIEYALRQQNLEGGVRVRLEGPAEFFARMEQLGGPWETYSGELYFSAHRGTYTTQARVKKYNRQCETILHNAELWAALAAWRTGYSYPADLLEETWKKLLLTQFHDILPGSSIGKVYEEVYPLYREVQKTGEAIVAESAAALTAAADSRGAEAAAGQTVFNALPFARREVVTLGEAYRAGVLTREGKEVPFEATEASVLALVEVPALGAVSLLPADARVDGAQKNRRENPDEAKRVQAGEKTAQEEAQTTAPCATAVFCEQGIRMENEYLLAQINQQGEICSFCLKEAPELEFAQEPLNHLRLFKDVPRLFDSWDIDANYALQELPGATEVQVRIRKASGLRAQVEVRGKIGRSLYEQILTLNAQSRRLEIATTIDWREQHRLLKASFPLNVYAESAINEIQFGYLRRPTTRSDDYEKDRFEVCNHRYSALCDGSHGGALLNDCKYGVSQQGNRLELSLLTAATTPDPQADRGTHAFTYAFTAWTGTFEDCDVVQEGYALNNPLQVTGGTMETFCAFRTDRDAAVLETVKLAEDRSGDLILRLYDAKKAAGKVRLQSPFFEGRRVWECDLLENKEAEVRVEGDTAEIFLRAFEVKTLRLQKSKRCACRSQDAAPAEIVDSCCVSL